jgi:hypothetical protein
MPSDDLTSPAPPAHPTGEPGGAPGAGRVVQRIWDRAPGSRHNTLVRSSTGDLAREFAFTPGLMALRAVRGEQDHALGGAGRWGSGRRPGGLLVGAATALLFLLGVGLFAVSLDAQYRYVFHAKHQSAASWIEALALDVGMAIFSLLALGLARAGKPARAERALIMACAAASGVMNFAAANDASPKSVLAYVMPPVFLAVVADRVVSVVRRHVLGEDERSPWLAVGH